MIPYFWTYVFTIFKESNSVIQSDILSQRKLAIAEPLRRVQSGLQGVLCVWYVQQEAHYWLLSNMPATTVLRFLMIATL